MSGWLNRSCNPEPSAKRRIPDLKDFSVITYYSLLLIDYS